MGNEHGDQEMEIKTILMEQLYQARWETDKARWETYQARWETTIMSSYSWFL